jgi:hypothetical protein
MTLRRFALLAVLLGFSSCSPPPPLVLAAMEGGKIVFHARERRMWFDRIFGWDDAEVAITAFAVEVDGEPLWQVIKGKSGGKCYGRGTFPIRYGEAWCGVNARVPPQPLKAGQRYDIRLESDDCAYLDCSEASLEQWKGHVVSSFMVRSNGSIDNMLAEK